MRKHSPVIKSQTLTATERIQERLAQLRANIERNRRAAIRDGKGQKETWIGDTPELRKKKWEKLASSYKVYDHIRKMIEEMLSADEGTINDKTLALGNDFLETAAWGDDGKIQVFVEEGFPVNYQDPSTGSTALHRAAACMARDVVRVLISRDECDFLIRDNKGRLPSEMAYLYGRDPALARLLGNKERKQAKAQGIKLTRRPKI